ncbi:L,D-transpeptidase family protein [Salipiger abyssi]|uniref:L,D-transpeptidase family protein n=1 Tax=Salipiger abyssi TaxID=1250539 RepID=UPI001A8E9845|nr:L,D-transpeptidase family protein [Salipiger abyssi]MBN9886058.1 L,D-transpeptidase family protein [Salipiger abyssi]
MRFLRLVLILALATTVTACSSKFRSYNGPEVTQIVVQKSQRRMFLLHNQEVLKAYDIGLGFAPEGHKQIEGDGRTPEGMYFIDRRNPNSNYHLSIGISYPNPADRAFAETLGKSPGGDIFIHGRPWKDRKGGRDWTAGCIAVTDREMEDIYAMVRNGTPIVITP